MSPPSIQNRTMSGDFSGRDIAFVNRLEQFGETKNEDVTKINQTQTKQE